MRRLRWCAMPFSRSRPRSAAIASNGIIMSGRRPVETVSLAIDRATNSSSTLGRAASLPLRGQSAHPKRAVDRCLAASTMAECTGRRRTRMSDTVNGGLPLPANLKSNARLNAAGSRLLQRHDRHPHRQGRNRPGRRDGDRRDRRGRTRRAGWTSFQVSRRRYAGPRPMKAIPQAASRSNMAAPPCAGPAAYGSCMLFMVAAARRLRGPKDS